MKNIFKSFMIALAAVSMFTACAEKEEGPLDPYSVNWTYLRPVTPPVNVAIITDAQELVSVFNTEETTLTRIQCTKPAPKDIKATITIDESLVEAYNAANETECLLMPHVRLVSESLTIPAGEYVSSDTLKIAYDVEALEQFITSQTTAAEFVLPITMTSVSDGGTISETRTVFVRYDILVKTAEQADAPFGVKYEDMASAVVTLNGYVTDVLNDGDDYWDEYVKSPSEIIVDFGKEIRVQSISIVPYAWYYMFKDVAVSFSTDGTNYSDPSAFSLYQAYDYYINFYSAKTARYVKLNTNGYIYSSGYPAYICELEFYVAE